ncbi:extracellular solute-binding protein [Dictyoglomus thermophilum]|uniref:Bacterial extracellular solute-binding protein n=1 Tax=Dictyoglomus thermophilum (strain ATCC 35947 / DSM 3960 / H-6-12) TaxID=309799 RepID=B5YFJ4_DICT6|nr:extracellular solute-binding protein [Dictyoglomus thermophilum]ACI18828.1 bacterial extracellular solute-binding protein [Dictyoglomus thermophilum H-6-12]
MLIFEKILKLVLRFISLLLFILLLITNLNFAQNSLVNLNVIFELISKENSYETYISRFYDKKRPNLTLIINAINYSNFSKDMDLKKLTNLTQDKHPVLYTGENGFVEWTFNIEEEGLYNIAVKYYPITGKNSAIEREIMIDGKRPFNEVRIVRFERIWKDAGDPLKDNRGNELRPLQIESPMWVEKVIDDAEGLYSEPFLFYFTKGKHTLRFISVKEPMVIDYIKIFNLKDIPSYSEIISTYNKEDLKRSVKNIIVKIQGEKAYLKSEPTLYPIYDMSNPLNEPYSSRNKLLNIIGGYNWRSSGQWIEWKFTVPEDGFYKIGFKFRQNANPGIPSERTLYIDGRIPFKEVRNIKFKYDTKWQFKYLGNGKDEYLFYLTKGEHTLRLKVTYESIAEVIRNILQCSIDLSQLYTKIVMITSPNPDPYRDYLLEQSIPDLIPTLERNAKILKENAEKLKIIGGEKVSEAATLERVAIQLEGMAKEPETIAQRLQRYRDNLSALSAWVLAIREQPLDIDYIIVASPDARSPRVNPNIFEGIWDGVKKFFYSFLEDYNMIGTVYEKDKAINVWVQMGRDQAETLKMLIDTDFTPKTGIGVNLNIITTEAALLFSVASRENPPDVALNVPRGLAVDYGIRGALVDISKLPGFENVKKCFAPYALVPYSFGGKVYGLPMTQDFPIMFYRADILGRLNIEVPNTWDELYKTIAKLQSYNLQFAAGTGGTSFDIFNMLLLQRGGRYYTEDGKRCILNNEEGVTAFKEWTNLYVLYGIPLYYDFFNRFRTGEMPLGIGPYTMYNQFKVAAPEISGLWGIAPVPGRRKSDGSIDRSVAGGGNAILIFSQTKKLKEAWEFVKWWVSTDVQARFGRELEAVLGAGARYNTANIEAMSYLPWPSSDYKILSTQWRYLKEIPNVPGSYYVSRHLDNAFREVVMLGEIPREAIEKYTREINKEIDRKREEFGLELAKE